MKSDKQRVLLIDDCRDMGVDCIARTYDEGIRQLERNGPWAQLYLDHDLDALEKCYDERQRELNGYDILCWLEEHLEYLPDNITIVSSNGAAIDKMKKLVEKMQNKTMLKKLKALDEHQKLSAAQKQFRDEALKLLESGKTLPLAVLEVVKELIREK
jgi:hypothetical protein